MQTPASRFPRLMIALTVMLALSSVPAAAGCIDTRAKNPDSLENVAAAAGTVVGILGGDVVGGGQPDIAIIGGELGCDFGAEMVRHALENPHATFVLGTGIYALGKIADGRQAIVFVNKVVEDAVEDVAKLATDQVPPSPTTGEIAGLAVTAPTLAASVTAGKVADKVGLNEDAAELLSTLVLVSNPIQALVEVGGQNVGGDVGAALNRLEHSVAERVDKLENSTKKRVDEVKDGGQKVIDALRFK